MNTPNIIIHDEPQIDKTMRCEFCDAVEGEPHPMRGFTVELTPPVGYDEDGPKACQSCRIHFRREEKRPKKRFFERAFFKAVAFLAVSTFLLILIKNIV